MVMKVLLLFAFWFFSSAALAQPASFGPTFANEIEAAGLTGLPFTWHGDGRISGRERLTAQQNATLNAVIAAHNPNKAVPNRIPFGIFISRWTDAEYALLMQRRATAIGNGQVGLVKQWDIAVTLGVVDLGTQAAQNFKSALVSANILTQARADIIFQ